MDHNKVHQFLLEEKCDYIQWTKIPPYASHMGGVWERMIRTVRSFFNSLLKTNPVQLDDELLHTFMCEAECIVNSRPLTVDTLADHTCQPLSPSNILTMKERVALAPPGVFQRADIYCRKRWRRVQYLADQFWQRWQREYLANIQTRVKWQAEKPCLSIGDVVLLKEYGIPRNSWPLGKVVRLHCSESDGLVRSVSLQMAGSASLLDRPVHKLVLLVPSDGREETLRPGSVVNAD